MGLQARTGMRDEALTHALAFRTHLEDELDRPELELISTRAPWLGTEV